MFRLARHVLCLLVSLSIAMGAVAHAGEAVIELTAAACIEDAAHESDGEPRDGESDKWGLHAHGGCHGHHQFDAFGRGDTAMGLPIRALNFAAGDDFRPQLIPDASLRPPIA